VISNHFTHNQWIAILLAAFFVGLAKSGLSGFGLLPVVIMARAFPALQSTGIVLPMLICGDLVAVAFYRRHAVWSHVWRLLPPAVIGIVAGFFAMQGIPAALFKPVIGWIVLMMVLLHCARQLRPAAFERVPHQRWFAWLLGGWAGFTTMTANAAGPVATLYLLAVGLPKFGFIGTGAWFFCIINLVKVPFSAHLGLINPASLTLNLAAAPVVAVAVLAGRKIVALIPQKLFEQLALLFSAAAAVKFIWF
jgi:uncharacterized protein